MNYPQGYEDIRFSNLFVEGNQFFWCVKLLLKPDYVILYAQKH